MSLVRNKRKKKPPACDACKARRVLCHSQPDGIACPRCVEKGVVCKTTPVQRGRPRTLAGVDEIQFVALPSSEFSQPSSSTCKKPPSLYSSSMINPLNPLTNVPSELSPDLVKHLFECFDLSLESRHPLLHGNKIQAALATVSWQLDLLPTQARVLGSCICAIASSISFHPAIIGASGIASFADRSVFFLGADLRAYGVRRAPMVRALSERAFTLGFQAGTYLDASEFNAASCFCLDTLGRFNTSNSRAWAAGYVSHSRIVAGSQESGKPWENGWPGFLMFEALAALLRRTPVLFSYNDQLLLCGGEPLPLEKLLESLQAMIASSRKLSNIVYSAIRPFMFHVARLARDLYNDITGDYARRRAVAETAIIQFLGPLSLIQSIISLLLTQTMSADGDLLFPTTRHSDRREETNHNACIFTMSMGFSSLVLALHKEVQYRVSTDTPTLQNRWLQERMGTLQRQVQELTSLAVGDVVRALQLLPSLPHLGMLDPSSLQDWICFCLDEAAIAGSVNSARARTFETFISSLKLLGYCYVIPESAELIERMEFYVGQHQFSSPSLAPAQVFSIDDAWTGMFHLDLMQCVPSSSLNLV